MEEHKELWLKIIRVHEITKARIIEAEEMGVNSWLGPLNELKNAYEHIIRSQSAALGFQEGKGEDYVRTNLEKALGHEYRAYFDAADWLTINIREKIINELKPYSSASIRAAIPDYYSQLRPQINEITDKIAALRQGKDIGNGNGILPNVEDYEKLLITLTDIYKHIIKRLDCIIECENSERSWRGAFTRPGPIVAALIGIVATLIITKGISFIQFVKSVFANG